MCVEVYVLCIEGYWVELACVEVYVLCIEGYWVELAVCFCRVVSESHTSMLLGYVRRLFVGSWMVKDPALGCLGVCPHLHLHLHLCLHLSLHPHFVWVVKC